MDHTLEKILARVQKPGRYVGGEYNAIKKEKNDVDCRFAFCFPDTYEIGMSNLGWQVLYGVINEMDGVWCVRVFPRGAHGGRNAQGGVAPLRLREWGPHCRI